jgi:hypothetical protein
MAHFPQSLARHVPLYNIPYSGTFPLGVAIVKMYVKYFLITINYWRYRGLEKINTCRARGEPRQYKSSFGGLRRYFIYFFYASPRNREKCTEANMDNSNLIIQR